MPGAVFLSYASQDAEVARLICDSLRAAGIEVWFDVNELVGGDAWDSKIKRQIRECTLFLPLISEQTQQRREGYFRLEWRLADERSRAIAHGVPFLIPVALDRVGERDALVPDSFLSVQWTRLAREAVSPGFVQHVRAMLDPGAVRSAPAAAPSTLALPAAKRSRAPLAIGIAAVLALGSALIVWRMNSARPARTGSTDGGVAEKAGGSAEFPSNPDLKRAWVLLNGSDTLPVDFELAETLTKGVLAKDVTNPEAVTMMAHIQNAYIYRGFDSTQPRRELAKHYSEQAGQLAPHSAYAQGAVGIYSYDDGPVLVDRAESVLNLAISLKSDEPMFYRFRDDALFDDPKVSSADALASAEATVRRFPRNALCHYELARHYRDVGRIHDMESELDKTLAIEAIPNALVWKARVALMLRGDANEMVKILNGLSGRTRSLERVAVGHFIASMVTGQAQDGLDFLSPLPENWIDDYDYVGPKAVLEATLYDLQGKHQAAETRWNAALTLIRERAASNPITDHSYAELWCLHGLGRDEEARRLLPTFNQELRRPYRVGFGSSWWFSALPGNLMLGDRATALQLLREALEQGSHADGGGMVVRAHQTDVARDGYVTDFRTVLYQNLVRDPRVQAWQKDPEILALLAPTGAHPN